MKNLGRMSRREREIMYIIYELHEATAAQVLEKISDPPSYSSIRALLKILEVKGHLSHKKVGPRYVFYPTIPKEKARQRALQHMLSTFFDGSTEKAVAALLDISDKQLSKQEYQRLQNLINQARKEGR